MFRLGDTRASEDEALEINTYPAGCGGFLNRVVECVSLTPWGISRVSSARKTGWKLMPHTLGS